MNKISIVRRGINARRPFRKLNSLTELVGKEVEVTDDSTLTEAEVEKVVIDDDAVTLNLSNGDEVDLDEPEVEELMETGEVTAEDDTTVEIEDDFKVTREVEDADGNVSEVTTEVSAPTEADAIQAVSQIDSRRKRNARSYRAVKRQANSEVEDRTVDLATGDFIARLVTKGGKLAEVQVKKSGELDDKFVPVQIDQIGTEVPMEDLEKLGADAAEAYRSANCDGQGPKEFKVARNSTVEGKKVRKIASVTAPTVEEAIEAVKAKDTADGIEAEGYAELVEELPESTVQINSDVDEVIEEPAAEPTVTEPTEPVTEPTEPTVTEPTEPAAEPTEPTEPTEPAADEVDRESNSFKGVASFIERKYGIKL